jgi:hypothetical protein
MEGKLSAPFPNPWARNIPKFCDAAANMFSTVQKKLPPSSLTMGKSIRQDPPFIISPLPPLYSTPKYQKHERQGLSCQKARTDETNSSGMCKAGFAGDDAPRAVFRKSFPSPLLRTALDHREFDGPMAFCYGGIPFY